MYDGIKIATYQPNLAKDLKENRLLNFITGLNVQTSELTEIYTAEYKNLTFILYPSNRVEIKGSLHKYWNEGNHNYNDFYLTNVIDTVKKLTIDFGINPEVARLENLEIGLNITTSFYPNVFIDNLIAFKQHSFNNMKVCGLGKGKEVYLSQYAIKIYNKGLQYKQIENILRIEKKIKSMQSLKGGLIYLSDLTNPQFAEHCLNELLNTYNEILVNEKMNEDKFSKPDKKLYDLALRFNSWVEMNRKQRHQNRERFKTIIEKHGSQKLHVTVGDLLLKKGYVLTDISEEKRERSYRSFIKEKRILTTMQK